MNSVYATGREWKEDGKPFDKRDINFFKKKRYVKLHPPLLNKSFSKTPENINVM